jgi:hypothetical protein
MELQEVVRVGQGEVHVQHVQDEHGQAPWGCSRESMNVPQEILALKLFKIRSTYWRIYSRGWPVSRLCVGACLSLSSSRSSSRYSSFCPATVASETSALFVFPPRDNVVSGCLYVRCCLSDGQRPVQDRRLCTMSLTMYAIVFVVLDTCTLCIVHVIHM